MNSVNKYIFENEDNKIINQVTQITHELELKIANIEQIASTTAHSFIALKKEKKAYPESISEILHTNLINSPQLFGIWSIWEPHTWDTHTDSVHIQNFAPYWNKLENKIKLDTLLNYNDPILGQYYLEPKKNRKTTILPPTEYTIGKKKVILSSIVYPVFIENDLRAVVGVDFNYNFFQSILDKFSNYTTASMAIYNNDGRILAHSDHSKIGKFIGKEEKDFFYNEFDFLNHSLKNKEDIKITLFSKDLNERITVFLKPIVIKNYSGHYSLLISEQTSKLYANKINLNTKVIILLITSSIFYFVVIFFIINHFTKPLFLVLEYILNIADENTNLKIHKKYRKMNDVRGNILKSIEFMNQKLKEKQRITQEQNEIAEWIRVGQSKLYDSMRGIFSIKDMSENILFFLCKYLDIQIGALYLHYEKTKYLKLSAAFSLTYDDNVNNYINIGEGLLGQAALDNKIVALENVENDYFYSSSSTLKILPKYLIVLPFSLNKKVIGVLEFGSYEKIEGKKLKLLENTLENIAIALNSVMIANKISKHRKNKKI
jgi:hypothetical protein